MDRQEAKEYVNSQEPTFLPRAKIGYICPGTRKDGSPCENGSGDSGTGLVRDPKTGRYHCFVCGLHEDVIGLWKTYYGLTDIGEAFNEAYKYYGVVIEEPVYTQTHNSVNTDTYTHTHTEEEKVETKGYVNICMETLEKADYAPTRARGISDTLAKKVMLGYDRHYKARNQITDKWEEWEALVIPTSTSGSGVFRNLDPKADKKNRYRKQGSSNLYCAKRLQKAEKPIVIVEGELDCLSIMEVGGESVALGSTANAKQLIKLVEKQKPAQPLILALDNDPDGLATTDTLEEELTRLDIPFYRLNLYGDAKDANEALQSDREGLRRAVEDAEEEVQRETEEAEKEALEAEKEAYMESSVAAHIQEFVNGIADSVNTPYIPTGFSKLDKELDGGLFEGLYILGAISSLGKTTLITQIGDQIAEGGNDVLIFSLEMARSELMAKSISRLTLLDVLQNNGNTRDAKTTRGITTGKRYKDYSKTETDLIQRATEAYSKYAGNIYINEGIGDIGTSQVRETVEKHISITGKRPVVIIDYIQILAPADVRATDKQNTDKAVLELKRISRDFKVPVIGISSFNRENYTNEVNMASFKESGSIEYSSDVLLGLQYRGAGDKGFNAGDAMKKNPRDVELIILKNRNGNTGAKIEYSYYKLFNYFKEV